LREVIYGKNEKAERQLTFSFPKFILQGGEII